MIKNLDDITLKIPRNYVYGIDILYSVYNQFGDILKNKNFESVNFKVYTFTNKQLVAVYNEDEEAIDTLGKVQSEIVFKTKTENFTFKVFEREEQVTKESEYDEPYIFANTQYDSKTVKNSDQDNFDLLTKCVSMNKKLMKNIFSEEQRHWTFVKIELENFNFELKPKLIQINFLKSFSNNKLTKSSIIFDDKKYGSIYFSTK